MSGNKKNMRLKKQHKIKRSNTICQMALDKQKVRLQDLSDITKIQCSDGNWNCDPYMHGLANGMILSLATVLGRSPEPYFKRAPEKWLSAVKKALYKGDRK